MEMSFAVIMIWLLFGVIGYLAEKHETYEVVNPFILVFMIMFPCFSFIFHFYGMF